MRSATIIPLLLLLAAHHLHAGNLNVINLSDEAPLEVILSSETADKPFTVGKQSSSGPFKLKGTLHVLKTRLEDLPDVEIPCTPEHCIAILFPAAETVQWRLLSSKAEDEKWSFRVINLTGGPAVFSHSEKEIPLENDEEVRLEVAHKSKIGITLPNGEFQPYPHREPCAVIAFLTKDGEETIVTFVADI